MSKYGGRHNPLSQKGRRHLGPDPRSLTIRSVSRNMKTVGVGATLAHASAGTINFSINGAAVSDGHPPETGNHHDDIIIYPAVSVFPPVRASAAEELDIQRDSNEVFVLASTLRFIVESKIPWVVRATCYQAPVPDVVTGYT